MEVHCLKCGAGMESLWRFCPQCGKGCVVESHAERVHEPAERAPLKGGFSGMLFGMLAQAVAQVNQAKAQTDSQRGHLQTAVATLRGQALRPRCAIQARFQAGKRFADW